MSTKKSVFSKNAGNNMSDILSATSACPGCSGQNGGMLSATSTVGRKSLRKKNRQDALGDEVDEVERALTDLGLAGGGKRKRKSTGKKRKGSTKKRKGSSGKLSRSSAKKRKSSSKKVTKVAKKKSTRRKSQKRTTGKKKSGKSSSAKKTKKVTKTKKTSKRKLSRDAPEYFKKVGAILDKVNEVDSSLGKAPWVRGVIIDLVTEHDKDFNAAEKEALKLAKTDEFAKRANKKREQMMAKRKATSAKKKAKKAAAKAAASE
jgi:hypothetical protein